MSLKKRVKLLIFGMCSINAVKAKNIRDDVIVLETDEYKISRLQGENGHPKWAMEVIAQISDEFSIAQGMRSLLFYSYVRKKLTLINTQNGKSIYSSPRLISYLEKAIAVAWANKEGTDVWIATEDSYVHRVELKTGRKRETIKIPFVPSDIYPSSDGRTMVCLIGSNVAVIDLHTKHSSRFDFKKETRYHAVSADGRYLVTIDGSEIILLELGDKIQAHSLVYDSLREADVNSIAINADGSRFALGLESGAILEFENLTAQ